jgi:hypothetical protein
MTNKKNHERLAQKIRQSIAMDRWQDLARKEELESMGLAPELYPRTKKRGRPLKYALQPPLTEGRWEIPIYRDEHIWQLFCKQKWQAGKADSNNKGKELNQCAYAVADILKVDVGQIWKRIRKIPKDRRDEIEIWIINMLFDAEKIHPKKLKKAKAKLHIDE